jgi:hypothetical protein
MTFMVNGWEYAIPSQLLVMHQKKLGRFNDIEPMFLQGFE